MISTRNTAVVAITFWLVLTTCAQSKSVFVHQYLSDTDDDYKYLESEQKRAYDSAQAAYSLQTAEEAERGIQKTVQGIKLPGPPQDTGPIYESVIRELHQPLPTRYEDPTAFIVLRKQMSAIAQAASRLHLPQVAPRFGTLPTNTIQGQTIEVPKTKDKIVLLNTQLFNACFILSKPVVQLMRIDSGGGYYYGPDYAVAQIKAHPELRQQWLQFILEYVGKSTPVKKYRFDLRYAPVQTTLVLAMELFAVAHEYGHVIKNHNAIDTGELKTPWGSLDTNVLRRSWRQELEADDVGTTIMLKAEDDDQNPLHQTFLGLEERAPLLFFKYADMLENSSYVLSHGTVRPQLTNDQKRLVDQVSKEWLAERKSKSRSKSITDANPQSGLDLGDFGDHPPAQLRRSLLLSRIRQETVRNSRPEEIKAAEIEEACERNIDLLFAALVPDLIRIHNGENVLDVFQSKRVAKP